MERSGILSWRPGLDWSTRRAELPSPAEAVRKLQLFHTPHRASSHRASLWLKSWACPGSTIPTQPERASFPLGLEHRTLFYKMTDCRPLKPSTGRLETHPQAPPILDFHGHAQRTSPSSWNLLPEKGFLPPLVFFILKVPRNRR